MSHTVEKIRAENSKRLWEESKKRERNERKKVLPFSNSVMKRSYKQCSWLKWENIQV